MEVRKSLFWLMVVMIVAACFSVQAAEVSSSDKTIYVSDILAEGLFVSHQGWGNLGIDTAAYSEQAPVKIQIGEQVYDKGLGHHASGEIILRLGGGYERFMATSGVQWQGGKGNGSVIFEIYVDDKQVFASDVMSDSSKPEEIDISVKGTDMMRLVAKDAGDGLSYDMANWAEARLVIAAGQAKLLSVNCFDASQFARVVTFNPDQQGGVTTSRYVTFREDEVFLEADTR